MRVPPIPRLWGPGIAAPSNFCPLDCPRVQNSSCSAIRPRRTAEAVKPPNSRGISKPNKTNRKCPNKTRPSLPIILPQKRTIEESGQVRIPWKQVHSAPAKTSQKVHKSAQNTPGNHPPTTTPSTTYEEFPAKTPHPPFLTKTRMELAQPAPIDSG